MLMSNPLFYITELMKVILKMSKEDTVHNKIIKKGVY